MKTKMLLLLLLLTSGIANSYNFIPSVPREGGMVAIDLIFSCPFYPSGTSDGQTQWVEISEENEITLTIVFHSSIGGCVGGLISGRAVYDLGHLPEGEYSLVIHYIFDNQTFPPQSPEVYNDVPFNFQVLGAIPTVPTFSIASKLTLFLLTVIGAWLSLGRKVRPN